MQRCWELKRKFWFTGNGDGAEPIGTVAISAKGSLYGTASEGALSRLLAQQWLRRRMGDHALINLAEDADARRTKDRCGPNDKHKNSGQPIKALSRLPSLCGPVTKLRGHEPELLAVLNK